MCIRDRDKDSKLNGDVIDGILSQEKKELDKVIINSAELEKYFGKDKSPREMKDKIISLLDDWKAKQPPELDVYKRQELLLLDEHTAALDPGTAEKVLALTQRVVAELSLIHI